MAKEFRIEKEIELAARPEQVWDAITTAAGNEAWLWSMPGDLRPEVPLVATWEQPEHLVVRMPAAEDGSVQAFEYVIEGRDGGTTVLRFVHSGVMSDSWEGEDPELTGRGWDMYLDTLAQYFLHFAGSSATYVCAEAPETSISADAWPALLGALGALGLDGAPAVGERLALDLPGAGPVEGVDDYVRATFLGVRTSDTLYRFHGRMPNGLPIAVAAYVYGRPVDRDTLTAAWTAWLAGVFGS
jgi:uncharacterized protein YndB with AHSA1/START domain